MRKTSHISLKEFVLLFLLFFASQNTFSQTSNTTGDEFYLSYLPGSGTPVVFVTASLATTGTISVPGTSFSQDFNINANSTQRLEIPIGYILNNPGVVEKKGIYISTHHDVSVFMHSYGQHSGASLVLPLEALDKEYMIHTYGWPSQFSVLSTEDNTEIEISFTADIHNGNFRLYQGGRTEVFTLNKGEAILLPSDNNLSGTEIKVINDNGEGCKKIAVFAGTRVLEGQNFGSPRENHFFNQMYPLRDWGKEYFSVLHPTSTSKDPLVVMASESNTRLKISSVPEIILDKGEIMEVQAQVDHYLRADKPISVIHTPSEGTYMMLLSPLKQTAKDILFTITDDPRMNDHYLKVITATENLDVRINGISFNDEFRTLSVDKEFSFAVIPMEPGTHRLESRNGAVAQAISRNGADGIAYAIGGNLGNFEIGIGNQNSGLVEGEACANDPIAFSATAENPTLASLYTNFDWDMGDGTFLTGFNVTHSYAEPGVYTVTLFASKSEESCTDLFVTRDILVHGPAIDALVGPEIVCPNAGSVEYEIVGWQADYQYTWRTEGGSIILRDNIAEIQWNPNAEAHNVSVQSTSPLGCVSEWVGLSISFSNALEPPIPTGPTALCGGFTGISYHAQNSTDSDYTWEIEGGTIVSGQGTNEIVVDWDGPGTHRMWYTESSTTSTDLCDGTSEVLTVQVNSPMTINISTQNVTCAGGSNGSAGITVSGGVEPYTFKWQTGSNRSFINELAAGDYNLTVIDGSGCEVQSLVTILEPEPLTGHVISRDAPCEGVPGSAEAVITGGTGAYKYYWEANVEGQSTKNDVQPGSYTLKVMDESGCEINLDFTIESPQALEYSLEIESPCPGYENGQLLLNVTGGTAPYTYHWEFDQSNHSNQLQNLPEGEYMVTVIDSEGCTIDISASLPNLTPLVSLPTVFSPNRDGLNDEFKAVYNCETTLFEMYIYNRWGNMVFQTKDIHAGWDGTYQGEPVPDGTYFYQVIFNKVYGGQSFTEVQKGNLRVVH